MNNIRFPHAEVQDPKQKTQTVIDLFVIAHVYVPFEE